MESSTDLARENAALRAQVESLEGRLASLREQYQALLLEAEKMKRGLFGQKRETASNESVLDFFDLLFPGVPPPSESAARQAIEELLGITGGDGDEAKPAEGSTKPERKPKKVTPHGRRAEPMTIEECVVLEPPERTAPGGDELIFIGEDRSTILERRPAHLVRLTFIHRKYKKPESVQPTNDRREDDVGAVAAVGDAGSASTSTEGSVADNEVTAIVRAPAPVLPIERGLCGPGLLAFILVSKFQDHLPLHRQERMFARDGVDVARSTMAGWIGAATSHLRFIVDAMWADAQANAPWIATDATGVLVRDANKCKTATFFVVIAPGMHVLFRAVDGHATGADVAKLLSGFKDRPVLSDASTVFHELHRTAGVIEVGCWAHARRCFFEALSTDRALALVAIGLIGLLFEENRKATDEHGIVDGPARKAACLPILEALDTFRATETPKLKDDAPLKKAFNYLENQREPLRRFLDDARLRLDNNISELELRRQAVGRKNWLFCGSDSGVTWNTTTTSLLASCAMHDIEPQSYLRDVLTLLPTWPVTQVLDLAPMHWARTRQRDDVVATLVDRDYLARATRPEI